MFNEITKKKAMEMLNGRVQLVGSYNASKVSVDVLNQFLINNYNEVVVPFMKDAGIRECVKQTRVQIKFKKLKEDGYTYLTDITNCKWYLSNINNHNFIMINSDNNLICYHIVED